MGASIYEFARTMLVLGLVIGLLLVLARVARRFQVAGGKLVAKPTGQVEVVSRRSLGKHSSLYLVRVSDRTFLVGQGAQQVTMLADLGGDTINGASGKPLDTHEDLLAPGTALDHDVHAPGAWDAFVDRLRELTVRR
ncbi:MAG: flagellar biosynthetic protein FliO [Acidobacteria bacterium]|nr:flagellar biosynthetic protein FliO [Acidobacteriota bacterium]